MWHWGKWGSAGFGIAGGIVGLEYLKGIFQPNLFDSMKVDMKSRQEQDPMSLPFLSF